MNPFFGFSILFYVIAGLLALEWFVFYLPGAQWNWARRLLFRICYPMLARADRFLFGSKLRGLLLALILMGIGYGVGHVQTGSTIQATL